MKKFIIGFLMLVTLIGCETDELTEDAPDAGSEDYTYILDADNPAAEMERRFKNAILQQGNQAITWDDFSVNENAEEDGVVAYFYYQNEDIYFALEETSEMSLTILNTEAYELIGDDLDDFVNIFFRTADPSLDIEEVDSAISFVHHLDDDESLEFINTDNISFLYSRHGFVPFSNNHFTDEINDDTHFYSAIPLSALPLEEGL